MNLQFAEAIAVGARAYFIKRYPEFKTLLPPINPEELTDEEIFEFLKDFSVVDLARNRMNSIVTSKLHTIQANKNPADYLKLFWINQSF